VCGGAPEVNASNNRVALPVTKTDVADVAVGMSSAFATTGAFGATAFVVNNGRAEAHDLSLRMTVAPSPAMTPTVATSEASANCTTDARGATCTLKSLEFGGNWAVGLSGLRYTGSEITITSTVTTGSPDPDSSNNQYVMVIPAGLKPPGGGSFPDTPGSTPGTKSGDQAASGCACGVRRQPSTGAAPWLVAALFATWQRRVRRHAQTRWRRCQGPLSLLPRARRALRRSRHNGHLRRRLRRLLQTLGGPRLR
jgi:MYXO-CTERM domain-containing protein